LSQNKIPKQTAVKEVQKMNDTDFESSVARFLELPVCRINGHVEYHIRELYADAAKLYIRGFFNASLMTLCVLTEIFLRDIIFLRSGINDNMNLTKAKNFCRHQGFITKAEEKIIREFTDTIRDNYAHYFVDKIIASSHLANHYYKGLSVNLDEGDLTPASVPVENRALWQITKKKIDEKSVKKWLPILNDLLCDLCRRHFDNLFYCPVCLGTGNGTGYCKKEDKQMIKCSCGYVGQCIETTPDVMESLSSEYAKRQKINTKNLLKTFVAFGEKKKDLGKLSDADSEQLKIFKQKLMQLEKEDN